MAYLDIDAAGCNARIIPNLWDKGDYFTADFTTGGELYVYAHFLSKKGSEELEKLDQAVMDFDFFGMDSGSGNPLPVRNMDDVVAENIIMTDSRKETSLRWIDIRMALRRERKAHHLWASAPSNLVDQYQRKSCASIHFPPYPPHRCLHPHHSPHPYPSHEDPYQPWSSPTTHPSPPTPPPTTSSKSETPPATKTPATPSTPPNATSAASA